MIFTLLCQIYKILFVKRGSFSDFTTVGEQGLVYHMLVVKLLILATVISVSSTNEIVPHYINEILLKAMLNTIILIFISLNREDMYHI
jgi:hypothetical protein